MKRLYNEKIAYMQEGGHVICPIDITKSSFTEDWSLQVQGTRRKVWLIAEDKPNHLFKIPKVKDENWAELSASLIGKHLGLRMMDVRLAYFGKTQCKRRQHKKDDAR